MRLPRLEKAYPSWRVLRRCWVGLPFWNDTKRRAQRDSPMSQVEGRTKAAIKPRWQAFKERCPELDQQQRASASIDDQSRSGFSNSIVLGPRLAHVMKHV